MKKLIIPKKDLAYLIDWFLANQSRQVKLDLNIKRTQRWKVKLTLIPIDLMPPLDKIPPLVMNFEYPVKKK